MFTISFSVNDNKATKQYEVDYIGLSQECTFHGIQWQCLLPNFICKIMTELLENCSL